MTAVPPAALRFFTVPAGTRAELCRLGSRRGGTCRHTVYFIRITGSRGGVRRIPIDCDVEGGRRPSATIDPRQLDAFEGTAAVYDGRGRAHFETCPDQRRTD